ncbi:MAG: dihydroneopterin aldolase [Candidatus Tectomicrobia bacterium]|nr:dihydroneopterin aldolase [Candidatus Tectomicrobia bacterium]
MGRDTIHLRNMQFYGFHGVNPEEKVLGQRFEIDVALSVDTRPAGLSDDLRQTINYAQVYKVVKHIVEKEKFDLIETLAETLAAQIGKRFGPDGVRISVRKPHVPLKESVLDYVAVEIDRRPESWQSSTSD